LGATGAGKTLLLETVMGFYQPDSGRILIDGKDVTAFAPEKRRIGYVPQDCVLFPHMDVHQNVEFGLRVGGVGKAERQKRVDAVLESAGLKSLEHRRPVTLSGGERQKVALARVLAVEPGLILLDEPLSALDAEASRELKRELKRVHKEGKTVVHVTHNQVEAFSLGTKMAIIRHGEIVQVGKTREVFSEPNSEFVARFLGYENVFAGQVTETDDGVSTVQVEGARLQTTAPPNGSRCVVAVRPEDIQVSLFAVREEKGWNVLEATVVDCTDQGHTVAITCDSGLRFVAVVIKSAFLEMDLQEGQRVWLSFKSAAVKIVKEF
jgi:ABC-type Fe3+/spermidine/putrescine transport system ATPase subunit